MKGLVLAIALGCAGVMGVPAAAEAASMARQSAEEQALQAWMADAARWSQGFQTLSQRQADLVTQVMSGLDTANAYFEAGDRAGGRAWAETWRAQRQAEIDGLSASLAAIDPSPPRAPEGLGEATAALNSLAGRMSALPTLYTQANDAYVADLTDMMDVIQAIAGGDRNAVATAPALMMTSLLAIGRTSIASLEATLVVIPDPQHPQAHLVRSSIASERAMLSFFQLMKVMIVGGAADPAATAREIRVHAADIQTSAAAMQSTASAMRQRMRANLPPGELARRMDRAIATYDDSAEIDLRLAASLRAVALLVDRSEPPDSPVFQEELTRLEQISVERFETDNLRRALMAG